MAWLQSLSNCDQLGPACLQCCLGLAWLIQTLPPTDQPQYSEPRHIVTGFKHQLIFQTKMFRFLSKKKTEECSTTNVTNFKGLTLSGREKAFIGFTILHALLLLVNLYLFMNSSPSSSSQQKQDGWF